MSKLKELAASLKAKSKPGELELDAYLRNLKDQRDEGLFNILITNIKGGVGKTSLARAIANYWGWGIVNNDLPYGNANSDTLNLPTQTRTLPKDIRGFKGQVFDFGAMHASMDSKLVQAFEESDLVIIPTTLDELSLKATIETAKIFEGQGKPIIILFNKIGKPQQEAAALAAERLDPDIADFYWECLPDTKLMQRMMSDGERWSEKVFNERGKHQLRKSWIKIQETLDELAELVEKVRT